MRRGDGVSMPDSPSKSKGAQWSGIGTFSKDPKRILTVPARAAGLVTCAALLTQAIALGWQFARDVALETVALPHAAALALALRGLVAGAAARAVFGASRGAGGALGGAVAAVFSFALVHGVASTPGGAAHVVRALSYPIGWTETVGAFACGALAMAAVMQFAVAMSMSPRHARFGVLLGMMVLGVVYGTMAVGCHVFASMSSCSVLMANLQ